jgi:dihydrofolate reductase
MPVLSLIVAMDNNRLIGSNNGLPWNLPADLQHFKAITMGKPIVMGRKTWQSLGRPLPGRKNIVITRDSDFQADGAEIVYSLDEALQMASDSEEVMIIGGANLYEQALEQVDRLYLTRVDGEFDGDSWFPEIAEQQWELLQAEKHQPDERNPHPYRFETWCRKS